MKTFSSYLEVSVLACIWSAFLVILFLLMLCEIVLSHFFFSVRILIYNTREKAFKRHWSSEMKIMTTGVFGKGHRQAVHMEKLRKSQE